MQKSPFNGQSYKVDVVMPTEPKESFWDKIRRCNKKCVNTASICFCNENGCVRALSYFIVFLLLMIVCFMAFQMEYPRHPGKKIGAPIGCEEEGIVLYSGKPIELFFFEYELPDNTTFGMELSVLAVLPNSTDYLRMRMLNYEEEELKEVTDTRYQGSYQEVPSTDGAWKMKFEDFRETYEKRLEDDSTLRQRGNFSLNTWSTYFSNVGHDGNVTKGSVVLVPAPPAKIILVQNTCNFINDQ